MKGISEGHVGRKRQRSFKRAYSFLLFDCVMLRDRSASLSKLSFVFNFSILNLRFWSKV